MTPDISKEMLDKEIEKEADVLLHTLFPICRSLTGDGVRKTLRELSKMANFAIKEIPSGTVCYDWTVPPEWNIRDAYIADSKGKRLVDFKKNNLHVVSYSAPISKTMAFDELKKYLYTLPALPQAIPYRTSYYKKDWGFCLSYEQYKMMDRQERYRVYIASTLEPGSMTYGECILRGTSGKEFLVSAYCCHPSLANDNLSGIVLWTLLLRELKKRKLRHSYRFLIAPETIGAIAYLRKNEKAMKKIAGGFIITSVAGPGKFGYKHTFLGDHLIDRAVHLAFRDRGVDYVSYPFDVAGSDERHFSAPYFRIPMGTICKDKYYEYDYYHTSLDDLRFVRARYLVETFQLYLSAIENLEMNVTYKSLSPYSEPQLGRRGLYPPLGGFQKTGAGTPREQKIVSELDAIRWLMFMSDGETSLLAIAERSGLPLRDLYQTAEKLQKHKLLKITNKT